MPIDASIISGLRTPQFQTRDTGEEYAKALRIQALMGQREMQDLQTQEARRGIADEDATRLAYREGGGDPTRVRQILGERGLYKPAQTIDKLLLESREKESVIGRNTASANKDKIDSELKQIEHGSAILSTAKDQPTWDIARRVMSIQFPQLAGKLPEQYDPQFIAAQIAGGQTIAQRIADQRKVEDQAIAREGHGVTTRGQDITRDTAVRGQDLTASTAVRGQDIGASTQRRGQDISASTQVRGQNLTDTRQREANAVSAATAGLNQQRLQSELQDKDSGREQAMASYDTAISTLDRLAKHPGFTETVGATWRPGQRFVPGSNAANFDAELAAFKAQTFLPMVQQLKGMGALSDAEGKKLSEAVGALTISMSEGAFKESVDRIKTDLKAAKDRSARARARPADNGRIGGVLTQNPDGSFNYGF